MIKNQYLDQCVQRFSMHVSKLYNRFQNVKSTRCMHETAVFQDVNSDKRSLTATSLDWLTLKMVMALSHGLISYTLTLIWQSSWIHPDCILLNSNLLGSVFSASYSADYGSLFHYIRLVTFRETPTQWIFMKGVIIYWSTPSCTIILPSPWVQAFRFDNPHWSISLLQCADDTGLESITKYERI
jgi:hypothetical protein